MQTPIRVLLVDDSPEFLESAVRFVSLQTSLEAVGRATSGANALEQVAQLHPDLVLMDWAMPEMSGLAAMQLIKAQPNAPRVVLLTMYDLPQYRAAAEAAGADGFLAKSEWNAQLFSAVQHLFPESGTPSNGKRDIATQPPSGLSRNRDASESKETGESR